MGFHRVTAAGHKNKALEYDKDVGRKCTLPMQHVQYFGLQARRDKVDASGTTKDGNANVAETHNQVMMMLGHKFSLRSANGFSLIMHSSQQAERS